MKSAKRKFSLDRMVKNSKFDFVGNLKYFIIAPIALALIALVLLCTVGFNTGIDFTGGTIVTIVCENYDLENTNQYNEVKNKIDKVLKDNGVYASIYQTTETTYGKAITIRYQDRSGYTDDQMNALNEDINTQLYEIFGYDSEDFTEKNYIQGNQRIGATASSELLMNAFIAMLVAIALILIYIAIRFELTSGMAAILALFQDIIVTAAVMLMTRVEINSSFIAALITIIGYSINNTIIIFDRIRENTRSGRYEKAPNKVIANVSIKETMSRSINTTFTTLVTIGMVAIIGVESIRQFAFPIIIGILAGFYSSVFIAPGLWAIAHNPKKRKKKQIKDKDVISQDNTGEVIIEGEASNEGNEAVISG